MTALVVIEGPDGSGKSSVCRLVAAMLPDAREWHHRPPLADRPRDPWSLALHYAAERAAITAAIRDGSEESAIVIADRWWMTAHAFVLANRGPLAVHDLTWVERDTLPPPALVVVLDASDATLDARRPDASAEERLARAVYRNDGVRATWDAVVVSAEGAVEDVAREVVDAVAHALRIARWHADNELVLRERGATTVCTCLAPPGDGHALHCARVLGASEAA